MQCSAQQVQGFEVLKHRDDAEAIAVGTYPQAEASNHVAVDELRKGHWWNAVGAVGKDGGRIDTAGE